MRSFIAIQLPKKVREECIKVQEKIKDFVKAKFVEEENFHITLKFLGNIDEEKVKEISKTLKDLHFKPFKLKLCNLGVFPSEKFVRVIWIGVKPKEKLLELQKRIDDCLATIGFKKEKRFEGHITIARIKYVKDRKSLLEELRKTKPKDVEFEVKSFELKKSTLTEKGPIYETLSVFSS
ncbi:RNA 2',3'-cyclic phosphodiesterase [Candidatus Pacearchaeota archaeon ex4484_31]|nr:MAG: RNA 2',3'-cyclic phosphodiesterase [Candidatus Pacearchaeota archaeon ex4484_31]